MKLVSFELEGADKLGILFEENVYPVFEINPNLPDNMAGFLKGGDETFALLNEYAAHIAKEPGKFNSYPFHSQKILAPVPHPTSCRDGYAFRQHVFTARRNRGVPMIPEFDQYPVFYFTNHNSITGPGELEFMPDHFNKLDFELEAAIVIGKRGRNIKASEADEYIAGYMVMNDWSARTLQMEEMMLNLGPAKGKDFATGIGPYLLTTDEMEAWLTETKPGHTGKQYRLAMKAYINGIPVSEGNLADMDWTFAELIERASYGVDVYPGDVIGSGTVGTGCFLELNGTGLLNDKNYTPQWIQPGDKVVMEIEHLGRLENTVKKADTDYSLLGLKKM